jgi:beta-lactamase class A
MGHENGPTKTDRGRDLSRRAATAALGASLASVLAFPASAAEAALARLEQERTGRLGVFALDTGSGRSLAWRADERFLMCSTFKALLVAAILAEVDAGRERLERRIAFGPADLFDYAPVARARLGEGALSVEALCQATVEVSDNTAATLLLKSLGGPEAYTRYVRSLGDRVTRLDRWELALNRPHGVWDTTSPRAMTGSLRKVLLDGALSPASTARLDGWMVAATPGLHRLRAGFPKTWRVGDKTGSGDTQTNDVALARPPGRAPLLVAAYYQAGLTGDAANAVHREVGGIVAAWAG